MTAEKCSRSLKLSHSTFSPSVTHGRADRLLADAGSAPLFSILTLCRHAEYLPPASRREDVRMSHLDCFYFFIFFVILSNECDNQLYMVMVHLILLHQSRFSVLLSFLLSSLKVHIYCTSAHRRFNFGYSQPLSCSRLRRSFVRFCPLSVLFIGRRRITYRWVLP